MCHCQVGRNRVDSHSGLVLSGDLCWRRSVHESLVRICRTMSANASCSARSRGNPPSYSIIAARSSHSSHHSAGRSLGVLTRGTSSLRNERSIFITVFIAFSLHACTQDVTLWPIYARCVQLWFLCAVARTVNEVTSLLCAIEEIYAVCTQPAHPLKGLTLYVHVCNWKSGSTHPPRLAAHLALHQDQLL